MNRPTVLYGYDEAVEKFGYSGEWGKYTLCEVTYAEFVLYAVAPICYVNFLDPAKHVRTVLGTEPTPITGGKARIDAPVLLDSLQVSAFAKKEESSVSGGGSSSSVTMSTSSVTMSTSSSTAGGYDVIDGIMKLGTDYTAAYDDDGVLVISVVEDGMLDKLEATQIYVTYNELAPDKVDEDDVLEALNQLDYVYTMLSIVPGIVAAPGFSENPTIAMSMAAHAANIDGLFRCITLADVDTKKVTKYDEVNTWKNNNNYTANNQIVCWPCVKNGNNVFHMSTHLLGIIGVMDAANSDVPYQSPSNLTMQITGLCAADGTEVTLAKSQGDLLNSQGIMTAINFIGGWKSWGNYTGVYPSNTDVKDCFICVRRMFDWQYQTFILTYWQKVDQPLMPRLVRTLVDSEQIRLNGLVSRGFLLGADVSFNEDENPLTDLLAGIMRLHIMMTPPVPAQDIEGIVEYDVNNFSKLFE